MRDMKNRGRKAPSRARKRNGSNRSKRARPVVIDAAVGISKVIVASTVLASIVCAGALARRALLESRLFAVAQVDVRTESPISEFSVRQRAAIPADAFLPTLDLAAISERIREDAWVETVTVSRHLPDTVRIHVTARSAWAVVQAGPSEFRYLDRYGVTFGDAVTSVSMREGVDPLPVISGVEPDADGQVALTPRLTDLCRRLVTVAARSDAVRSVEEMHVADHTVTVFAGEPPLELIIPYTATSTIWDMDTAWERAERVLVTLDTAGPRRLDLRYTRRVAVRLARTRQTSGLERVARREWAKGDHDGQT